MTAGPPAAAASSITAIAAPNMFDQVHRAPRRSRDRASVGSVGDSYDNALAETINGLYKAEVIHRRGPWRYSRPSSSRPSSGWTGSTIAGFSSPSATSRPPRPRTLLRHAERHSYRSVTQTK